MQKRTQLDIILPVYNERYSIEQVVRDWYRALRPLVSPRFIVCEDGSTDGTKEVLVHLAQKFPLTLDSQQSRRGYGKAVVRGIERATSEFVLCVDTDGQYDPEDFQKLWNKRLLTPVIVGVRTTRADPVHRHLYSGFFRCLFQILFHAQARDPSSPFVLFRRTTVLPILPYLGFLTEGFWWGFSGVCIQKDLRVAEVPVHHRRRTTGTHLFTFSNIPGIALRNIFGLIRLRASL